MIALHCNRCGRESRDLAPEMPAVTDSGPSEESSVEPFYVCAECYPVSNGRDYRYCTRCGQETPSIELAGGRCDWCRAADEIPFDEPSDEEWWADKAKKGQQPSGG